MANDNDTNLTPEEHLSAMLGLLADVEAPLGPTPTLKEIQDWHLGKLDDTRAIEVKSHVARDPACFQQWRELVAAEKEITEESVKARNSIKDLISKFKSIWFRPLPLVLGSGLATAAVALIIVLTLPLQDSPWTPIGDPISTDISYSWPYENMSITRGGELSYQQKVALQFGIRSGIENKTKGNNDWVMAMAGLPDKLPSCRQASDIAACEQQTPLLKSTGIHAGVMYLACLEQESGKEDAFTEQYWRAQTRAWKTLAEQLAQHNLSELAEIATSIHSHADDKAAQCAAIRDLIYLSY